jgi:hypothetical protein
LTVRDLIEQVEALQWRERQAVERTAWQTAWLLQAMETAGWIRNAPTMQQLLAPAVVDSETALDRLTGEAPTSLAALDGALAVQAARKVAHGDH